MIIITVLKAARDIWVEGLRLRRELSQRYPGLLAE